MIARKLSGRQSFAVGTDGFAAKLLAHRDVAEGMPEMFTVCFRAHKQRVKFTEDPGGVRLCWSLRRFLKINNEGCEGFPVAGLK